MEFYLTVVQICVDCKIHYCVVISGRVALRAISSRVQPQCYYPQPCSTAVLLSPALLHCSVISSRVVMHYYLQPWTTAVLLSPAVFNCSVISSRVAMQCYLQPCTTAVLLLQLCCTAVLSPAVSQCNVISSRVQPQCCYLQPCCTAVLSPALFNCSIVKYCGGTVVLSFAFLLYLKWNCSI